MAESLTISETNVNYKLHVNIITPVIKLTNHSCVLGDCFTQI